MFGYLDINLFNNVKVRDPAGSKNVSIVHFRYDGLLKMHFILLALICIIQVALHERMSVVL